LQRILIFKLTYRAGIFFFQRFHSKKRTFLFCHTDLRKSGGQARLNALRLFYNFFIRLTIPEKGGKFIFIERPTNNRKGEKECLRLP